MELLSGAQGYGGWTETQAFIIVEISLSISVYVGPLTYTIFFSKLKATC